MTDEVVLGALLHDIGDFSTRAGGLRKDGEGEKASDDPLAHTANFFRDALGGRFPAAEKVVLHHRNPAAGPDRTAALTAALADRLSSGKSGPPDGDGETGQDPGARLRSIFSGLVPKESRDKPGPPMYFPLKTLTADMEAHFPTPPAETGDGEGLPALWADFVAEVRRLDFSDDSRFFRQLLSLLEKYTLFIPMAARGPDRDVSLFHHLKSSAAIASCLSQLNLPESTLQALYAGEDGAGEDDTGQDGVGEDDTGEDDAGEDDAGEDGAGEDDAGQDDTGQDGVGEDDAGEDGAENPLDEEAFYLVGADLSGIQSFIYSVASKGALKGLRGRSLYLTLLVETTAESILREIGLNPSCLIYSGGGHFRILAPKTDPARKLLERKRTEVNGILARAHQGAPGLNMAWEPLTFRDFRGAGFGGAWIRLGAALAREKRRPVRTLLKDEETAKTVLGPFPASGDEAACAVCGEFTSAPLEETEEEKKRCPLCKSLETLAGEAARAQYLGVRPGVAGETGERLTHYKDVLSALGCEYDFREKSLNPGEELRLNNVAFLGPNKSFLGFRFMAKHGPLAHGGGMLTLEDLAMEATGVKKWGVLRADVDDLGWTFRRGLGEANQGMARISGLSHLMSLYFSAHIQRLAEQTPFRRGVSLVYSGGDDLFIIGSWSMLPDLARRIQAGFSRFTSGRLRISAGVFLAPTTGFPVHQAAEMAGVEEDLAKSAGKDRISIFESPTPWSSFRELADIKDKLVGLLVNRCPRALLTILYAGWEEQRLYLKKEIPMFRVWRLLYAIQRLTERNRRLGPALTVLKTRVVKNLRMPDHCNVAIRWAEFYTHK